jgi:hypothetical protein
MGRHQFAILLLVPMGNGFHLKIVILQGKRSPVGGDMGDIVLRGAKKRSRLLLAI